MALALARHPAIADLNLRAVLAFVAGQVAPYKRIRLIECLPEIHRSPSGKILRRLLRFQDHPTAGPVSASGSGQLTR